MFKCHYPSYVSYTRSPTISLSPFLFFLFFSFFCSFWVLALICLNLLFFCVEPSHTPFDLHAMLLSKSARWQTLRGHLPFLVGGCFPYVHSRFLQCRKASEHGSSMSVRLQKFNQPIPYRGSTSLPPSPSSFRFFLFVISSFILTATLRSKTLSVLSYLRTIRINSPGNPVLTIYGIERVITYS